MQYKACIRYDEKTVGQLDTAISNTFFFARRIYFLVLCVILIVGGTALGMGSTYGIISILLGCVLLPSVGAVKSRNARQIIRYLNGRSLTMEYVFRDDGFTSQVGNEPLKSSYDSVIRLVEENGYLYLFQKKTQACMVDVSTLEPAALEDFKRFVSQRVGLAWTPLNTLRNIGVRQYRLNRENTRRAGQGKP